MGSEAGGPHGREWTCPTCGGRYRLIPAGAPAAAPQGEGATDNQIKAIHAIIRNNEQLEMTARRICKDRWGVESTKQLTKKQASELIDMLKSSDLQF